MGATAKQHPNRSLESEYESLKREAEKRGWYVPTLAAYSMETCVEHWKKRKAADAGTGKAGASASIMNNYRAATGRTNQ